MKDEILDFFQWYDLYDIPIVGLSFAFETQTMTLLLDSFSVELNEYVPLHLVFKGVSKYTFEYPTETYFFEMVAIYQARINKKQENDYELHLLIDMPKKETRHGKHDTITVGEMRIGFQGMEIIGGQTREEMAKRYQELE